MSEITLKDYIDQRTSSIDRNIDDLRSYIEKHFELNDKALKLADKSIALRLSELDKNYTGLHNRVKSLETTRAFSAGKMWMVMAIFGGVPTVLATIALFLLRG